MAVLAKSSSAGLSSEIAIKTAAVEAEKSIVSGNLLRLR
jgi:hypothetical protein